MLDFTNINIENKSKLKIKAVSWLSHSYNNSYFLTDSMKTTLTSKTMAHSTI